MKKKKPVKTGTATDPSKTRRKRRAGNKPAGAAAPVGAAAAKPSSLIDTRVVYCGDCLEQLQKLPDACIDLIYIDPPFNSNRNYEVFWGETKEKRAFEDRHASTQAYIDYMRPRCAELGGIPNKVRLEDMGIDGRIFPVGSKPADTDSMFAHDWFPIQVKQSEKVGRPEIDRFEAVMERENRQRGFFVAFSYTQDSVHECAAFHKRSGRLIKLLTVQEILEEEHVQKM